MLLLEMALGNKFFYLVGFDDLLGGSGERITGDAGWLSRAVAMVPTRSTRALLGRLQRFEFSHDSLLSLHCCFVWNVPHYGYLFVLFSFVCLLCEVWLCLGLMGR